MTQSSNIRTELESELKYPTWEFAPTYGGDEDGFSDAFIEAFTGDIDKSLAREVIQNSLDARLDNSLPVKIFFQKIEINSDTVPEKDTLNNIFTKCLEYYPEDKKVKKFFTNALEQIQNGSLCVLKISDSNTLGLRGSDTDKKGEWYCLVKAQGASSKQEEKQGSFGIGKGAPFAASNFRTVFYSTINDKNEHVFQGKARLVSHEYNGIVRRGSGSFGLKNQASIRDKNLIPEFFKRESRGTDIFIIAYRGSEKNWQNNLINSVLENFWAAILNSDLIVSVGTIEINKENLEKYLLKYCGLENPDSPYHYYLCLKRPTKTFTNDLVNLGTCNLYIQLNEIGNKKVALMRKSRMLIKNKRFHSPKAFIGLFICDDKMGNEKLRDLEPPQHNDWEPKRTENGTSIIKELEEWIRSCLKEMTRADDVDISAIPGLEKYFQLPEDADYEGDVENFFNGVYTNSETETETSKNIDKKEEEKQSRVTENHKEPVINYTDKSDAGKKKRIRTGASRDIKSNKKGVGGGEQSGVFTILKDIACTKRTYLYNKLVGECEYILILNPLEDFIGSIKLAISGDDTNYPAELLQANDLESGRDYNISSTSIKDVELRAGVKKRIKIRIKSKNKTSLIID